MAEKGGTRKLAAILCADVAAYSRLVREDEERTLAAVKADIVEIFEPGITSHRGRIFKTMGDAVLAEFASVVDAVRCAVELQRDLAKRNANTPADRRIEFRIGVNLGDVVTDGSDVYGDGVNVAARVQGVAEPGGICISEDTYRHLSGRIEVGYEDLGPLRLKNIDQPIRVYRIQTGAGTPGRVVVAMSARLQRWKWPAATAVVALVALLAAGHFGVFPIRLQSPDVEPARPGRIAFPLPDKPSIAVLPFANLSEDKTQEYFADGMADDIITDLSKISGLFVIARNSSFQFKGQNVDVRQIAEKLGVRFVLAGSVRRAGGQIRINAQLTDAKSGGHVWAERFDSELADVFELQNQVTQRIVNSLAVTLTTDEQELQRRNKTANPDAHDVFLRGWAHYQRNTPRDYAKAIPYLEEAIKLDPQYRRAFAALAAVYWNAFANGRMSRGGEWVRSLDQSLSGTFALAADNLEQALEADSDPLAYQVLSGMLVFRGQYVEAIAEAERAIALDSNDPAGYDAMGRALMFAGQPSRSIDILRTAIRLDPHYAHNYQHWLGLAQFSLEKFDEAARSLAEASQRNPDDERVLVPLAANYGMLGREEEGRRAVVRLNDLRKLKNEQLVQPGLTPGIDLFLIGPLTLQDIELWPFKEQSDRERLREGLKRVGVPASGQDDAESPKEVPGAVTIDVATARILFGRGVKFVDVRGPSWNLGHIPGATHLFLKGNFGETSLASVARKNEEVVFYCMGPSCLLSSKACAQAVSWGYEKVYYFRGGFPAWQAAGNPVEISE